MIFLNKHIPVIVSVIAVLYVFFQWIYPQYTRSVAAHIEKDYFELLISSRQKHFNLLINKNNADFNVYQHAVGKTSTYLHFTHPDNIQTSDALPQIRDIVSVALKDEKLSLRSIEFSYKANESDEIIREQYDNTNCI